MADCQWITEKLLYLGDAYGNPKQVKVGVVKIGKRKKVGFQLDPTKKQPKPDYTTDLHGLSDVITELNQQRRRLIAEDGIT